MREDSGTTRIDADKLVFDELLWIMPQFWKAVPPLTPAALFNEHAEGEKEDGHGDHEGYTDETLRRAITQGVDPGGKPLDRAMPEWSMSTQDLDDLIAYLKSPAVKPR